MLAKDELEKAKANSDLNSRIGNLEMLLKGLGDRTLLGDPSALMRDRWVRVIKAIWIPLKRVVPQSRSPIINFLLRILSLIPLCLILTIRGLLPNLMELTFPIGKLLWNLTFAVVARSFGTWWFMDSSLMIRTT